MKNIENHSVDADVTSGEKVSANEDNSTELKIIKFIGIDFDYKYCQKGEDRLNEYLRKGFKVLKDYQTPSGVVVALGFNGSEMED